MTISQLVLILVLSNITMAASSNSQALLDQKLTVEFENEILKEILGEIENLANVKFAYDVIAIRANDRLSLKVKNEKLSRVLDKLLGPKTISYEVIGNQIILKKQPEKEKLNVSPALLEVRLIVSGTVTSTDGETLPGVTVLVKGTSNGTVTDIDGKYSLNVANENDVLSFSSIGFVTQEVTVNGKSVIDVSLEEDTQSLEEVVVVGFGEQKKVNLTGAVSTVETKVLTSITSTDLSNSLAGRLPGLRVMQIGGEPGQYDNSVDIRGWGNMLVVVDGIPREDFQRIDPSTIASVTVLKDASAAVYGVKAANGVMLITTKKGVAGKMEININSSYGTQQMTEFPKAIRNSVDNLILKNEAALVAGNPLPYPDWEKYTGEDPDFPSVDYWGLVMRENSPLSKNNISFNGGSEKVTYFMSVGSMHQADVWKQLDKSNKSGYNRYNFTANVTAEIYKNLTANFIFKGMIDDRDQPYETRNGVVFRQNWMEPAYSPIYANNNPDYYYDGLADRNPLAIIDTDLTGYRKFRNKRYESTISLVYDVPSIEGLQMKGLFAYDMKYSTSKQFRKAYNEYKYNSETDTYAITGINNPTNLQMAFDETIYMQTQLSLNYRKSFFDDKHGIEALILGERRSGNGARFSAQRNYALNVLEQLDAGLTENQLAFGRDKVLDGNLGLVGRLNYDYNTKYLAEFSFRYDGSSLFPETSRWGFFPAFSMGWRINEEAFFRNATSAFDNLKLRFSHGVMGDDSFANGFEFLEGYLYPSGAYIFDGASLTAGAAPKGLNNPFITWYTATTSNIGLDGNLWRGLLDFQFDFFQRKREGLLATRAVAVPKIFGTELPQENLESDLSRGLELVLGHSNQINGFNYSIRGNFTYTRVKWLHKEAALAGNSYLNWRNRSDDRWKNIRWGYGYEGQFQNQEEINNAPVQNANGHSGLFPGDVRYEDWNEDGMINDLDQYPIGRDNSPEIFYGLDLSGGWKGFTLSVFFQGATNYSFRPTGQLRGPLVWGRNSSEIFLDRWHHEVPLDFDSPWVPGRFPISRDNFGYPPNQLTSKYIIQDVTYLRLKNVEIGYNLPIVWANKVGAQQIRIYGNAMNVYTWKGKDVLFDPEHRLDGPEAQGGYKYPLMANFNGGLNVTF